MESGIAVICILAGIPVYMLRRPLGRATSYISVRTATIASSLVDFGRGGGLRRASIERTRVEDRDV